MACNDKLKIRCKQQSAECIKYERELPTFSELEDCVTIAETTEELYDLVGDIKGLLDFTSLTSCQTLPTPRTPLTLFQTLLNMVCTQQTTITTMQGQIATMTTQIANLQSSTCP